MTLTRSTYSTRTLSFLMVAAFAGAALWLFAPWGGGSGPGAGNGRNAGAALPPSVQVDGPVQSETHGDVVTRVIIPLTLRGDQPVSLGDGTRVHAETVLAESASAAVPATYSVAWSDGNGDSVLDPGEHATLTVDLPDPSSVHPANPLSIVIRTPDGARLTIEDVLVR